MRIILMVAFLFMKGLGWVDSLGVRPVPLGCTFSNLQVASCMCRVLWSYAHLSPCLKQQQQQQQ